MSLIKPFVLLYLLQHFGHQTILNYVDMHSSEHSFNSLAQLELDQSKPRNPMINSGAIACYSSPLDQAGNSVSGLYLLKQLAQTLHLSVFN